MRSNNKYVVYTALVGGHDYLRPVPKGIEDIDFICFTDGSISEWLCKRKGWVFKNMPNEAGSSRKGCRLLKAMPHRFLSEYNASVWLDSNISFSKGIGELFKEFVSSKSLVRGFRHPNRDCAYSEADECIRLNKDTRNNIGALVDRMRWSGFPEAQGLTETNVLFRKHNNEKVKLIDEYWRYFLMEYTIRDQISFDYLCWYYGIDVWYFEGSTHQNRHPVFYRGLHRSDNKIKDMFSHVESYQGLYPVVNKVISTIYRVFK